MRNAASARPDPRIADTLAHQRCATRHQPHTWHNARCAELVWIDGLAIVNTFEPLRASDVLTGQPLVHAEFPKAQELVPVRTQCQIRWQQVSRTGDNEVGCRMPFFFAGHVLRRSGFIDALHLHGSQRPTNQSPEKPMHRADGQKNGFLLVGKVAAKNIGDGNQSTRKTQANPPNDPTLNPNMNIRHKRLRFGRRRSKDAGFYRHDGIFRQSNSIDRRE